MNVKPQEYVAGAVIFSAFAALLWLFGQGYYPGIQSPLTSLKRLRNVIVVQDQAVGSNVIVSYAALSEPSYILIRAENDPADRILTVSRLLPDGEYHNFRVAVEGGLPNGFYYGILRRDDGDGRYDPERDAAVRDTRGAAAITRFLVSDAPSR